VLDCQEQPPALADFSPAYAQRWPGGYSVYVGGQTLAVDQPHSAGLPKFNAGDAVHLGLDPSQMRLFPA